MYTTNSYSYIAMKEQNKNNYDVNTISNLNPGTDC